MKNKKALIFLIIWVVVFHIGGIAINIVNLINVIHNDFIVLDHHNYPLAIFTAFIFIPFLLLPLISLSFYFSIKERIKPIKIVSLILILEHIFIFVCILVDWAIWIL